MVSTGIPYRKLWLLSVLLCSILHTSLQTVNDPENDEPEDDELFDPRNSHSDLSSGNEQRHRRYLITKPDYQWPNGVVPYQFLKVSTENGQDILGAMATYEYWTPLRFVPWNETLADQLGHQGHLKFTTVGGRGWSLLGFVDQQGGQGIDCPRFTTCIHEIGHALGFEHEQYHPLRDKWIRVNKENLGTEFETYQRLGWGSFKRTHFDVSSFMLYGPRSWNPITVLFPEAPYQQRYFYMFKEFCDVYDCANYPQCRATVTPVCYNQGFVSVVDNKCACVCPPGFDPKTGCKTNLKQGPSQWPSGAFAFLEHKDGCPQGTFHMGRFGLYDSGDNKKLSDDFKGDLNNNIMELSFCSKTASSNVEQWPTGKYCFPRHGGSCPNQKGIFEASITFAGGRTDFIGMLPDMKTSDGVVTLEFCCVHTGMTYLPMSLPSEKPFILFAHKDKNCQQVEGMNVTMKSFAVFGAKVSGNLRHEKEGSLVSVDYCVYTPVSRDCGDVIELGPKKTSVTIQADKSSQSLRECNWLIQNSKEEGTLVMDFDEFSVNVDKTTCDDSVEIQPTLIAQKGYKYCHLNETKSVTSLFSRLRVQFRSGPDSNSFFKATIRWIPDSDMCYNAKDYGISYRGNVNYTRNFEPCLPWSDVQHCPHHTYRVGDFLKGLDYNFCRNPDESFRPWCYTKSEGCERNFCDVCHIEKPFDMSQDCDSRARNGLCNKDDVECAKSCNINQHTPVQRVSELQCPSPTGTISGGSLTTPSQERYNVGDNVTYTCTNSQNTIESTCLSTVEWSDANTACLGCPAGYSQFRDTCYKYHDKYVSYEAAAAECKKDGALLAMPKTQGETDYIADLRYHLSRVWIGAQYSGAEFIWADGTPVTWFNWKFYDVPHKEKCVYLRYDNYWKSTDQCSWEHSFVCQKPVTDEEPDCQDFLTNCPSLVSQIPSSNCDLAPELSSFCRYSCDQCTDCKREVELTAQNDVQEISSDMRQESHRFCVWKIKAPSNPFGRITLQFNDFTVEARGADCVDSIEIRQNNYGLPYTRHCNVNYTSSFVIRGDFMLVKFKTPGVSSSHFKATVKWIPDSDMCYNIKDAGWSYRGNVNYGETFQKCLPWSEAVNCVNNTIQTGYLLDGLDGDLCRNPDGSDRPWCYNSNCEKQFCDVCHLKKLTDSASDCQNFKNSGLCSQDLSKAATQCAGTCQGELMASLTKVSSVTCGKPDLIYGAVPASPFGQSYTVGQNVTYKCGKNQRTVKRTCLSDGTWSTANTACLECPYGFIPHLDKCYKYFNMYTDKQDAIDHCKGFDAVVATPKTLDENSFISSLRNDERIWLGGKKGKDAFYWSDGSRVELSNWMQIKKLFQHRDECMVMEKEKERGTWTDDWCQDKLFHFVCQVERLAEEPSCEDYLGDTCTSLVDAVPGSYCDGHTNLQMYCHSSCLKCSRDCAEKTTLTSDNDYQFERNPGSNKQFCTWTFTGSGQSGRFLVTFDTFNVGPKDSFDIKRSSLLDPVATYSGSNHQRSTYITGNTLHLQFLVADGSDPSFKFSVKWIGDSDTCYDVKDNGWSYNGDINFSKTFKPCIPWSMATKLKCVHHPLQTSDYLDRLEGNKCRNPDNSDQPWCYTNQCQRESCDVCQHETPTDNRSDCAQYKARGQCTKDSTDCAKTCDIATAQAIKKVSSVKCGTPGQVSKGKLEKAAQTSYSVGDVVLYRCTQSNYTVERVCLSNGEWSAANTACLECPLDFVHFKGKCYKFVNKQLNYTDAMHDCQTYQARLATPKTLEEATFLDQYSFYPIQGTTFIWLGAYKNEEAGEFYWNDKTPIEYDVWASREPFAKRDDCMTMAQGIHFYDDWCHDKAFDFVCQLDSFDEPECKDFLDNCPDLLSSTGKTTCEPYSRLETLCRETCGVCSGDCEYNVQLNHAHPVYELSTDRKEHDSRFCTWTFKANNDHGRFVIQFDHNDFDVQDVNRKCVDKVEIRASLFGDPLKEYCNGYKEMLYELEGELLIVQFKTTKESKSRMKARVEWIDDSDMCYAVKDKGWSYNGKVNYTEEFSYCRPWHESFECTHTPFKEEDILDNLEENYCRNPDKSDRPWCYTRGCSKEYCDVCHLEKPVDRNDLCPKYKENGLCESSPGQALRYCAATCNLIPSDPIPKAKDIHCGTPEGIPGSKMVEKAKQMYSVGDQVTYQCSTSHSRVERTCLTSGDWSVANTACLDCPVGWEPFNNKCYKMVNQYLEYYDAVYECKKMNAIVATAKDLETSNFLGHFIGYGDDIWLGARKDKKLNQFVWSDGETMDWTHFIHPEPLSKRDDCIHLSRRGTWNDDWCNNKFFSFVCQLDSAENPHCIDFTHTCPKLVQLKGEKECDHVLNKFCRRTCGSCT